MDIHFAYLEEDLYGIYNNINPCMIIQISLAILNDQYDYMYDQFFKKVKALGKCSAYYIYKGIQLPEYYITHVEGDNCYKVYRYDKQQDYL